jgi:ABC-2 type transport system permease protein
MVSAWVVGMPSPAAYVAIKMLTSLVLAAGAVAAVYLVGAVTQKVSMPAHLWVITGLCVWIGSLLFAAFGLFAGYLLPSENMLAWLVIFVAGAVWSLRRDTARV